MPSPAHRTWTSRRLANLRASFKRLSTSGAAAMCIAAAVVMGLPSAADALLQQAHNSRVVVDLPAGFEPAPLFSGFINERLGVSYVILESPREAYDEIIAGFTPQELAKRGITDPEPGSLARSGDYVYMQARQASPAGTYAKFFAVFRTEDQAILISANVPVDALRAGTVTAAGIEQVLASAKTVSRTAERELYRLDYLGQFKQAGTLIGTSKVYTRDGRIGAIREGQPHAVFMVAPSLDTRPVKEPHDFATRLLTSLTGYRDIKFDAPAEVSVDGHTSIAIEAQGADSETGTPVDILQVLLPAPGGGYFRLLGIAPRSEALLPEFRRMAQSFKLAAPEAANKPSP